MENYYLTSILQVLLKYYVRNWSPRKLWESQVKHGELKDPLQVGGHRGFLSGFFISSSTKRTPNPGDPSGSVVLFGSPQRYLQADCCHPPFDVSTQSHA